LICLADLVTPQDVPSAGPQRPWREDYLFDVDAEDWKDCGAWFCSGCFDSVRNHRRILDMWHRNIYVAQTYRDWRKQYMEWADQRAREWKEIRKRVHA